MLKAPSLARRIAGRTFWILYDLSFVAALILIVVTGIYSYSLTDELIDKFEGLRWKLPGKVYSDSLTLLPGLNVRTENLQGRLIRQNYQQVEGTPTRQGEFSLQPTNIQIFLRDFEYPWEKVPGVLIRLDLADYQITTMFDLTNAKQIYSADLPPEVIGRFFGPHREERNLVTYREISPYLTNAIVAIEDKAFYTHHGVNIRGLARSMLANLKAGALVQGGSSITQQLVKNFYLTSERTLRRKIKEMPMALVLEMLYTKEEIFECYLNEVYFGQSGSVSICGVGEAAKFYFGKDVRHLDLAEAALLAGLIRSPDGYNPRKRVERAKMRRDYILAQMSKQGLISEQQAEDAKKTDVKVQHHTPSYTIAPYFIEFLKKQLSEKYSPEVLISEGLKVFTTLDVEMQRKAEAALRDGIADLEKRYKRLTEEAEKPLQASIVVIEPQTGAIRAMVGGRNFGQSQYNRAIQSKRQTGSVFKPFVYCTALVLAEKGKLDFSPASILIDEPVAIPTGAGTWRPQNYSKTYLGPVTARIALEKSINIPAVKTAQIVGIDNVVDVAHKLGIRSEIKPYPAVALGSADLSLLEIASAYSTLATLGSHSEPISIRDVVNLEGEVLDKKSVRVKRAIPAAAAFQTVNIMKGVIDRGTAARARAMGLKGPMAGKTGTTDNYRDAWFVGFSPNLLAAVWVGFDQEKNLGLAGGTAALPIWARFMIEQTKGTEIQDWDVPSGIEFRKIDYKNGKLAVYGCPEIIEEAFLEGHAPEEECDVHKDSIVEFFKNKGKDKTP